MDRLRVAAVTIGLAVTMGLAPSQSQQGGPRQAWRAGAKHRAALPPDVTISDAQGRPQQVARCGTRSPSPLERQLSEEQVSSWLRDKGQNHRAGRVAVPTWFHVIYIRKGGRDVGKVSRAAIEKQITVAKKAFKKSGFKLVLTGVD